MWSDHLRTRGIWFLSAALALTAGRLPAQSFEWRVVELEEPRRQAETTAASDFWIGVECFPAGPELRLHLDLAEEGLLVEQIVPDSPGAKAGLQRHDVLIEADGQLLRSVADLVEAIDRAKGQEIELKLFRAGKERTLAVTPENRPAPRDREALGERTPDSRWVDLMRMFEQFRRDEPQRRLGWKLLGPGAMLPSERQSHRLPDDMTVTITRHADEPAKIEVQQGEKSWATTEDRLAELPDEVRAHVEQMLGRATFRFVPRPGALPPGSELNEPGRGEREAQRLGERLQQQMEEMNRQFDRLRKQLEELENNRPR